MPTYAFYTFLTPLAQDLNGTATGVEEKLLQCEYSFSVSHDHLFNETTLIGHVGKDASMSFANPGKFFES